MQIKALLSMALAAAGLALVAGCSDRDPAGLEIARARVDPVVFDEELSPDVYFQPFFGTVTEAIVPDATFSYQGTADAGDQSLKITVPPAGSSLGIYAGGVLTSGQSRDLTDFNALSFYARAESPISLDTAGFGNDNTGTSRFEAGRGALPLTTEWQRIVIPVPNPAKLIAERGMFTFAESADEIPAGFDFWVDEIRFTNVDDLVPFRVNMQSVNRDYFIGSTVSVAQVQTIFELDEQFVIVNHQPGYLDFASSNPAVVRVGRRDLRVVGVGTTTLSAKLQDLDVSGVIGVTGHEPPDDLPERPGVPSNQVISMFSDSYADVPVTSWRADWQGVTTILEDYVINGENMMMYSALNYVGVDFVDSRIDASEMTHFHMDVYAPAGDRFNIKLVSFPESLGGTGAETPDLRVDATTTPAFVAGEWSCLDIPLADFTLPATDWDWSEIGQLVFSSSNAQLILFDNVYWHR